MSECTSVNTGITGMNSENFSVITGMSKLGIYKNKKPKNLSSRKYKINSVYEEEWLVESLNNIKISEKEDKNLIHLINLLIDFNLI